MGVKKLTEQDFWEKYWQERGESSVEMKRTKRSLNTNALIDVFDKYLEKNPERNILEIGGAPGQYLMYMAKNFGYRVASLDYSSAGNAQTVQNFKKAGMAVDVYERDLFSEKFSQGIPQFDIVYSLGFVEHFENLQDVIARHLQLLKPGGKLIIGVPNLRGIYKWFLKQTAPGHLAIHNLKSMDARNWQNFETALSLKIIYRAYIGGFEPLVMKKLEKKNLWAKFLNFVVKILMLVFSFNFNFLRKYNSPRCSGYLIGVYEKRI